MTPLQALFSCLGLLSAGKVFSLWLRAHRVERQLKLICPGGFKMLTYPLGALQLVVGTIYPMRGNIGQYYSDFRLYASYGSTCLSCVSLWGAIPTYFIVDAEAATKICADRHTFIKDVEAYEMINVYGPNVVSAEGDTWRRHRAVSSPAFSEGNNAFVWTETLRTVEEWFADIDNRKSPEQPIHLSEELSQITLLVISSTGFGRRGKWNAQDTTTTLSSGEEVMAFQPAVTIALSRLLYKVLTPSIAFTLSRKLYIPILSPLLRETTASFDALRHHMLEVISSARAWVADGKKAEMDAALLRNLVEANMFEEGRHITDDELLSNTLAFLLAGQETTAHTLSFTFSILALYPDLQERIRDEVLATWPLDAKHPAYKDYSTKFQYTVATFMETLRLFPAVPRFGKIVQRDTIITGHKFQISDAGKVEDTEPFAIPLQRGNITIIDVEAIHRNPMYWGEDVDEFKPEHFIDTETYHWPRDAFYGFSGGARTCLGQRFATTEAVSIMASVLRRYDILVPPALHDKSFAEQKRIMLHWYPGITCVPTGAKTVFRLR